MRAARHSATTGSLHEATTGLHTEIKTSENQWKESQKGNVLQQQTNAVVGKSLKQSANFLKADGAAAYRMLRLRKGTYQQVAFNEANGPVDAGLGGFSSASGDRI